MATSEPDRMDRMHVNFLECFIFFRVVLQATENHAAHMLY
jgi:hypothetical protein